MVCGSNVQAAEGCMTAMDPCIVLWPKGIQGPGFCFGWAHPVCCVAGVLETNSYSKACELLSQILETHTWRSALEQCGSNPIILGFCSPGGPNSAHHGLTINSHHPNTAHIALVHYDIPVFRQFQLYSLQNCPIKFEPDLFSGGSTHKKDGPPQPQKNTLDFTRPRHKSMYVLSEETMNQINYSQVYTDAISANINGLRVDASDNIWLPPKLFIRSVGGCLTSLQSYLRCAVATLFPIGLYRIHRFLEMFFATAQQTHFRVSQIMSLSSNFPTHVARKDVISAHTISKYMRFYNIIWLILNDTIIGISIGALLCENSSLLARLLDNWLRRLFVEDLQSKILWLNNWPAGLKLNTELSQFYCHSLLGILIAWNKILQSLILPYLPQIIYMLGVMGICGLTMILSLILDLLMILTAHVQLCYLLSCTVYQQQLQIIRSLWNLSRGKRYNILRRRTDTWSYDLDQLMFGTILFTLTAFLAPTLVTYYALFAVIRLTIISVHAILGIHRELVNGFPLFALMLRLKDPLRIPGGISFHLCKDASFGRITNEPLSVTGIFSHYTGVWSDVVCHYHPLRLAWQLLTAETLIPIAREITH